MPAIDRELHIFLPDPVSLCLLFPPTTRSRNQGKARTNLRLHTTTVSYVGAYPPACHTYSSSCARNRLTRKMPSHAATSALVLAATCFGMLDTTRAFVVQVPNMTGGSTTSSGNNGKSNKHSFWGKQPADASYRIPIDESFVGFGKGQMLPHTGGFGGGKVVHLPRVPSAMDYAGQKRPRASSCSPLEQGLGEVIADSDEVSLESLTPNTKHAI